MAATRGHRTRPHTADVIVEAWGDDLAACIEEAAVALIRTCFDTDDATGERLHTVELPAGSAEAALLGALDEVIFVLDTAVDVPVEVRVIGDPTSGPSALTLSLADRASVEPTGAGPKAISRSDLTIDVRPERIHCAFLVDV